MNNKTKTTLVIKLAFYIGGALILFLLFACNPISGIDVLRGNDTILPVITISSPSTGDPYVSLVTVIGTVTDMADDAGAVGVVESVNYEIVGTNLAGTVDIDSGGCFNFNFSTVGLTGTITIKVTATDWNGNVGELTFELLAPKEITYFAFLVENNAGTGLLSDATGLIVGTDITISVPDGTDVRSLTASFEISGVEVKIGTIEQANGLIQNDFTDIVQYIVVANDNTTKIYAVNVSATPLPPGSLSSILSAGTVELSWEDNANNETGYEIQRKGDEAADYTVFSILNENRTTYTDIDFYGYSEYNYRVRSVNDNGPSEWILITVDVEPATPTNLETSVSSSNDIDLLWTDESVNAEGFEIQRKSGFEGVYEEIDSVASDQITYFDSALLTDSVYFYRVRATNKGITSSWSNIAEAFTHIYIQQDKLLASDGAVSDFFGFSVAVSGDNALVGAYGDDTSKVNSGSAYMFNRNSETGNWTQVQKLTANDASTGVYFGNSVAISGNYALIGAFYDNQTDAYLRGSVYIFELNSGTWTQKQKLTASDAADSDHFGYSVAIYGDYAVIGANKDNSSSGSVYIFKLDSDSGTWTQVQKLTASDGASNDFFGCSVAIDSDYIVIGAQYKDGGTSYESSGSAYIFKLDSGTWTQVQKLTASDRASGDNFGSSVAISGDHCLIGAYLDNDIGDDFGSAYIFKLNSGTWTETQKLTSSDGAEDDRFGNSVAIFGDYAITGAYLDDDKGDRSGSAYIFENDTETGLWSQVEKFTPEDGSAADIFGFSVSITSDYAVIGAYGDSDNGENSGSVYIYEK